MAIKVVEGAFTAIVTPFDKRNNVDYEKLKENIEFQIENDIDGIVPCGTTGESATLSMDEHKKIIETCVDAANGRIKVIAGTGSNNTTEAIELTKHAKDCGADACLLISPYYNKPTQEGIYQHFKKISEIDIPLILYNIQSRTAVNIEPDTIKRLSEIESIIGVKEASGNFDQISDIIKLTKDRNFSVISGNDSHTLPIIALGGKGVISVVSNIIPKKVKELVENCLKGNFEEGRKIHYEILNLVHVMFVETNPIPIKFAMNKIKENKNLKGMNAGNPRLPLVEPLDKNKKRIEDVLRSYGLI